MHPLETPLRTISPAAPRLRSKVRLSRVRSKPLLTILALVGFLAPLAMAGATDLTLDLFQSVPPHPRLLADAERFQELRGQIESDPTSARLYAALRSKAEAFLEEPPVRHEKLGRRLLGQSRRCQERVLTLAFVARMSGDPRYAARAITEMRAAAAFPDWNPSHFLDTAEMTLGLAIGYDWLHDQLAPDDRAIIAQAIIEKGLRPSIDGPREHLHWMAGTNNWNQVCHTGMVAGALALAEEEPALALAITQRAVDNVPKAAAVYAPDGAYPEGSTYWNYGTSFHVILVDLLQSALGRTEGLESSPGFMASADYIAQVTTPTSRFYNYADSREGRPLMPALFWWARQQHRPELLRTDLERLDALLRPYEQHQGDEVYRLLSLALIWWRPAPAADLAREARLPLNWLGRGPNPVAVFRSAWNDPRAVYIGLKGGSPSSSHAHMDAGSFIFEADGVRWAVDPGLQNYQSLESKGVELWNREQDSQRWQVFRIGADAHNILRFNGADQRVAGRGVFSQFVGEGATPRGVLDLGSLYDGQAASVQRGIALCADRGVLIQDEWTAGEHAVAVTWQWLTEAEAVVDDREVMLTQSGETLRLCILSPDDVTLAVEDVSTPRRPYDAPNPGLRRIIVDTSTPAGASGRLQVLAIPGTSSPNPPELAAKPLAQW